MFSVHYLEVDLSDAKMNTCRLFENMSIKWQASPYLLIFTVRFEQLNGATEIIDLAQN